MLMARAGGLALLGGSLLAAGGEGAPAHWSWGTPGGGCNRGQAGWSVQGAPYKAVPYVKAAGTAQRATAMGPGGRERGCPQHPCIAPIEQLR